VPSAGELLENKSTLVCGHLLHWRKALKLVGQSMQLPRRQFLHLAAGTAATAVFPQRVSALDYPTQTVRIVVGFPPGGPTDIFARLIGQWLSVRFGQPVVVENRPGAGSTIGVKAVVTAPPDGYTLLLVSTSAAVSASYYKNPGFNLTRDIAPVCGIALEPLVMVVNPAVPAKTLPEFIDYAKANPGKLIMASVGNGTTPHLAGELFMMMAGVKLLHVPYHGASPALTDLLGGRADLMFEAMPSLVEYIRTGKLRALAVTPTTRSPVFPEIPTVGEFLPGYAASVWFGIGAPRQTPVEIVERLNKEINAGLNDATLNARLGDLGGTALTGSSGEFEKLFIEDTEKWAKVIRAANIKAD
jgi:tripartite-type tricarboxylate transporter receptor subunit TctC